MTDFPSLPTDNLYKFATACGLALLVGGVLMLKDAWNDSANLRVEMAEYPQTAELSRGANLTARYRQAQEKLETTLARYEKAALGAEKDAIQPEVQQLFSDAYLVGMEAVDWGESAQAKLTRIKSSNDRVDFAADLASTLIRIGTVIVMLSLPLWYWKHQRFQDELLRASTLKAVRENNSKAKGK